MAKMFIGGESVDSVTKEDLRSAQSRHRRHGGYGPQGKRERCSAGDSGRGKRFQRMGRRDAGGSRQRAHERLRADQEKQQ